MRKIIGAALVAAATGLSIAAAVAVPANAADDKAARLTISFVDKGVVNVGGTNYFVVQAKAVNNYGYDLELLRKFRGDLRFGATGAYFYANAGTSFDSWRFKCGIKPGAITYELGGEEVARHWVSNLCTP